MADFKQINDLAKSPGRARQLAGWLLTIGRADWTEWEVDFLEAMARRDDELTTRQAEKLVELNDDALRYAKVSGYNLRSLAERCWLNRLDLDDADLAFIERIKAAGQSEFRKAEALRLRRIAVELGEIDADAPWSFPSRPFLI